MKSVTQQLQQLVQHYQRFCPIPEGRDPPDVREERIALLREIRAFALEMLADGESGAGDTVSPDQLGKGGERDDDGPLA